MLRSDRGVIFSSVITIKNGLDLFSSYRWLLLPATCLLSRRCARGPSACSTILTMCRNAKDAAGLQGASGESKKIECAQKGVSDCDSFSPPTCANSTRVFNQIPHEEAWRQNDTVKTWVLSGERKWENI